MKQPSTHCYIARDLDGKIYAVCVDMASCEKQTAAFVAEQIKGGGTVERMTIEDFRKAEFGTRPFRFQ